MAEGSSCVVWVCVCVGEWRKWLVCGGMYIDDIIVALRYVLWYE